MATDKVTIESQELKPAVKNLGGEGQQPGIGDRLRALTDKMEENVRAAERNRIELERHVVSLSEFGIIW